MCAGLVLASSCAATQRQRTAGLSDADSTGRAWYSLSASYLGRSDENAALDDGPLWLLEGGYALTEGEWRPAVEVGAGWSRHDVPGAGPSEVELDVYRGLLGLRYERVSSRDPWSGYARAGWFYRRSSATAGTSTTDVDQDGGGLYLGFGADYRLSEAGSVGLFLMRFEGTSDRESELTELVGGVSFRVWL